MRQRTRTWAVISAVCFIAGILFWKLGDQRMAQKRAIVDPATPVATNASPQAEGGKLNSAIVSPLLLQKTKVLQGYKR